MSEHMTPQEPHDRDTTARDELAAALGAQDDEEATAFTDAAAELAMLLPPVAPNPATKAALMAQLGAVRGETSDLDSAPRPSSEHAQRGAPHARGVRQAAPGSSSRASTHPPSRTPRARVRRPVVALSAIAAALLLFFGGFASRSLMNGSGPAPTANADPVLSILSQPDALRESRALSDGGTATLVWSAEAGRAAVIVNAKNPVPSGKTYELWFIRSGAAIPAGVVSGQSAAPTARELSGAIKTGDEVAITVEPARGSPQPTTKPIVVIPTST